MTGMFSVARCDEANGMGWGGNWEAMDDNAANKIATADGGETWELLTPGGGPGYRSCVQYVPNSDCQSIWAVGIPGSAAQATAAQPGPLSPTAISTRYGSLQTAKPPGLLDRARSPAVRSSIDHFTTTVFPGWLFMPMTYVPAPQVEASNCHWVVPAGGRTDAVNWPAAFHTLIFGFQSCCSQ